MKNIFKRKGKGLKPLEFINDKKIAKTVFWHGISALTALTFFIAGKSVVLSENYSFGGEEYYEIKNENIVDKIEPAYIFPENGKVKVNIFYDEKSINNVVLENIRKSFDEMNYAMSCADMCLGFELVLNPQMSQIGADYSISLIDMAIYQDIRENKFKSKYLKNILDINKDILLEITDYYAGNLSEEKRAELEKKFTL